MIEIKVKVGSRGQIVIPKPIREMFHITNGEYMFFRVQQNKIQIRKEEGQKILENMLQRIKEKKKEPKHVDWKEMYYSQFEDT